MHKKVAMNIALIGYGKMGKEVEHVAHERGLRVARVFDIKENDSARGLTRETLKGVDVCIDFSTPAAPKLLAQRWMVADYR